MPLGWILLRCGCMNSGAFWIKAYAHTIKIPKNVALVISPSGFSLSVGKMLNGIWNDPALDRSLPSRDCRIRSIWTPFRLTNFPQMLLNLSFPLKKKAPSFESTRHLHVKVFQSPSWPGNQTNVHIPYAGSWETTQHIGQFTLIFCKSTGPTGAKPPGYKLHI